MRGWRTLTKPRRRPDGDEPAEAAAARAQGRREGSACACQDRARRGGASRRLDRGAEDWADRPWLRAMASRACDSARRRQLSRARQACRDTYLDAIYESVT